LFLLFIRRVPYVKKSLTLCCYKNKNCFDDTHTQPPTLCWLSPIRPLYCVCLCVYSLLRDVSSQSYYTRTKAAASVPRPRLDTSKHLLSPHAFVTPLNFHSIKKLKKNNNTNTFHGRAFSERNLWRQNCVIFVKISLPPLS